MSLIEVITDIAKENGAFQRNRVAPEKKVLVALLCFSGFTYRQAAEVVGGISYVGVHDAFMALRSVFPYPTKKQRRAVTVEEARSKLSKESVFVWGAKDQDTNEVLLLRCSLSRSADEAERFILDTLAYCDNSPLFSVDGGPWQPQSFKKFNLPYRFQSIGVPRKLKMWFADLFA
jgi:transposase-like protein